MKNPRKENNMYFIITRDQDGEIHTEALDKTGMADWLKERMDEEDIPTFVKDLKESDPQYWKGEEACLIIKGEIVVPKPKEVTTKYEF